MKVTDASGSITLDINPTQLQDSAIAFVTESGEERAYVHVDYLSADVKLDYTVAGIGLDMSIRPTWSAIHIFNNLIKAHGKIQVSGTAAAIDAAISGFPIQVRPSTTGEIFSSYKGSDLEAYSLIGGSWVTVLANYDEDYGDWS